ncbi:GATOR complex protein NPRL2 [Chionoecetes opilio]|uniref:GATOR complex protein NPRL2 n=1 Tax=Chionoecetes opilio TaxID=41210 RepID=A0A8J5CUS8_CHIOP|nr:GATOR complex protein NPRL2 [Chionoecetes opilio]
MRMSEEYGKEGPVRGIFLAEFDPVAGPKIVHQYPDGCISKEVFDAVSVFIIPKPEVMKRIVTVNVLGVKITGYPNEICSASYKRNALIFNLAFVCDSSARTVHYEPGVKKLSEYLENLELEDGFLSSASGRARIPTLLRQVLEDLNRRSHCTITITLGGGGGEGERRPSQLSRHHTTDGTPHERRLSLYSDQRPSEASFRGFRKSSVSEAKSRRRSSDNSTTSVLHLKVVRLWPDPLQVEDYHVPVLISERVYSRGDHWDLTTQQILPYIDGFSHVAKIAAAADVDNNLVKACVENLLYYEQVRLLPIFQYSNVYVVREGVRRLYEDPELQEECRRALAKHCAFRPQLCQILELYCSMTYGVSVRDLCIRHNPQALNIDERRMVQFGLTHHIIRRLHRYPLLVPPEDPHHTPARHSAIHSLCSGQHSYDEICCRFGLTFKELHDIVERDPNIRVVWK